MQGWGDNSLEGNKAHCSREIWEMASRNAPLWRACHPQVLSHAVPQKKEGPLEAPGSAVALAESAQQAESLMAPQDFQEAADVCPALGHLRGLVSEGKGTSTGVLITILVSRYPLIFFAQ